MLLLSYIPDFGSEGWFHLNLFDQVLFFCVLGGLAKVLAKPFIRSGKGGNPVENEGSIRGRTDA